MVCAWHEWIRCRPLVQGTRSAGGLPGRSRLCDREARRQITASRDASATRVAQRSRALEPARLRRAPALVTPNRDTIMKTRAAVAFEGKKPLEIVELDI